MADGFSYGPQRDAVEIGRQVRAQQELAKPIDPNWFHKMSLDDQKALVRAGWKGDQIKPQFKPGELIPRRLPRDDQGRVITEYDGDPEGWMNPYKSPMRARVVAFANERETATQVLHRIRAHQKEQKDARDLATFRKQQSGK